MWVGAPGAALPLTAATAQRPQCELPGALHGPRPMTGRLRMLTIIHRTEHKGATRGLSRPGAHHGHTGALVL